MVSGVKLLSGFSFVGILFFSSCKSSDTTPSTTASVGVKQSARLISNVIIRADSIQDSRCPLDVTCIWGGVASVKLALSTDSDSTNVRLTLSPQQSAAATDVKLSNVTYKIILHEVNPYPISSNLAQPKTAVVELIKL